VKAWSALHRFRPGAPFRPWILQIVANEARNRRRAAGRRAHLTLRTVAATPSGEAAPSPEANAIGAEQREELLAAVNELARGRPARDRLPLLPRAFGGGDRSRARAGVEEPSSPGSRARSAACANRHGARVVCLSSSSHCAIWRGPRLAGRARAGAGRPAQIREAPARRRHVPRRAIFIASPFWPSRSAQSSRCRRRAPAILEFFISAGVTIQRVEELPTVSVRTGLGTFLGDPVSLAQARSAPDFDVVVPEALGVPDEVYFPVGTAGRRHGLVRLRIQG
jgi:hypothetical protein